jgi:hypothetical protein
MMMMVIMMLMMALECNELWLCNALILLYEL